MASIPVAARVRRVDLVVEGDGRASVVVRIAPASVQARLKAAAGVKDGDTASQDRYHLLLARWGVSDGEGLIDPATGAICPMVHAEDPVLGRLAGEGVADAIAACRGGLWAVICAVLGVRAEDARAEVHEGN